ncbi:MAG: hypothetical protein JXQ83_04765 [Candidatus Glassbacteria bacterium]|nr:hypothetical protein [Candidatus Glassbacteria bacterium]
MKSALITVLFLFLAAAGSALADEATLPHSLVRDSGGRLLAWHRPEIPGAAYAHVAGLAAEFLKTVPVEPTSGLKLYMVHADFNGPGQDSSYAKGTSGTDWIPNPACVFAGFVQSLAVDYRVFSGDESYLEIVRECLDQMLANGTTCTDWPWPDCPYASADPRSRVYQGGTRWEKEGRGDGLHCIEPDKVGELGIGYLKFYQITGEARYLEAAIDCADALAANVRDVLPGKEKFGTHFDTRSPWPFRVNARTGVVVDEYTSNVVEPVRLFDELIRTAQRTGIDSARVESFRKARSLAWEWLFALNGPMKTFIWNGYFEDIPSDHALQNRVQITPLETARYILKHPEYDPSWKTNVPALLHWVAGVFATEGLEAIREQTWCYFPMGSHTSRYASVCAMYYEKTGERRYLEEAFRFFNFATYVCEDCGYVWVGPGWETAWFSDGYGDYIRHFMEGLAAVPEWAPAGENHLLRSTSVVQTVSYGPRRVSYRTYDLDAVEVLRLGARPKSVRAGAGRLDERVSLDMPGWTWEKLAQGGVLRVDHRGAAEVVVEM